MFWRKYGNKSNKNTVFQNSTQPYNFPVITITTTDDVSFYDWCTFHTDCIAFTSCISWDLILVYVYIPLAVHMNLNWVLSPLWRQCYITDHYHKFQQFISVANRISIGLSWCRSRTHISTIHQCLFS